MSSDDDDKGSKDNVGRKHKPSHAKDQDHAPTGSKGTVLSAAPILGLGGTGQRKGTTQAVEQSSQSSGQAQPANDKQEKFPETTDQDVNKFYGETQHMIPKDSAEHPDNAKKMSAEDKLEGPRISQSEYARAFQQARDSSKSFEKSKSKGLDLE